MQSHKSIFFLHGPFKKNTSWIQPHPIRCELAPYAEWCKQQPTYRGWNWEIYQLLFANFWIALVLVIVLVSMVLLYCTVRAQETRAATWSDAARNGRDQKRVVNKAIRFISVYLVVFVPSVLATFVYLGHINYVVVTTFLPGQGIFNALVYSDRVSTICGSFCSSIANFCCCADGFFSCNIGKSGRDQSTTTDQRFTLFGLFSRRTIISGASSKLSSTLTQTNSNNGGTSNIDDIDEEKGDTITGMDKNSITVRTASSIKDCNEQTSEFDNNNNN